eukprot:scaffold118822_cov75-Phaeocystis_antarctica.AAC.1
MSLRSTSSAAWSGSSSVAHSTVASQPCRCVSHMGAFRRTCWAPRVAHDARTAPSREPICTASLTTPKEASTTRVTSQPAAFSGSSAYFAKLSYTAC